MIIDAIRSLFGSQEEKPAADTSPAGAEVPAVEGGQGEPAGAADPIHVAACALLLEIAYADGEFSEAERMHLEEVLERHFNLPAEAGHRILQMAEAERTDSIDQYRFTSLLQDSYDTGQKMVLAEIMWGLVLADGEIAEHEHYLTRKISNLLGLSPGYLSAAKAAAAREQGS